MVAVVVGSRLGLEQTSGFVLGSRGQLGSSVMGRAGENVYVNAATGNLIVNSRDEFLVGLGINSAISRTYNSQGQMDGDNNDGWRLGVSRRISGRTGTLNAAGSTVTRTDWDGSQVVYTWNADRQAYLTTEGSGAYDNLVAAGSEWIWTDGDSQVTETYADAGNQTWRLIRQAETDGNGILFSYNTDGYISRVAMARSDGTAEYTDLTYAGAKLTDLRTTYYDDTTSTFKTLTRTRYAYDAAGRLSSVTVDLSPEDSSVQNGASYVTAYTYDGTSTRIASISQTDGSRLDITYDTSGRVLTYVQTVAMGVTRTTALAYISASRTDVTGPDGLTTSLEHDALGQLVRITEPAATAGGTAQVRDFTYDAYGNVLRVQTSPTTWTDYVYDDVNGNGVGGDHNGLWTRQYQHQAAGSYLAASRTYNSRNAVLTETRYLSPDANPADGVMPGDPLTTRYVYDSENHLRYTISAGGSVVQYDYSTSGNLVRTIRYTAAVYPIGGLATTASVSAATMVNWVAAIPDQSAAEVTETIYDYRGAIKQTIAYSTNHVTGGANGGLPATRTLFVYDQAGQLLSRHIIGNPGTEAYVYDGLGRLISATDFGGATTTTAFHDALGTTVVRLANGLNQVSVYDRAGQVVSYSESERGPNLINLQGWPQAGGNVPPPTGSATVNTWSNLSNTETRWQVTTGPSGRQVVAMQAGQFDAYENGGGNYTHEVQIDGNKAYEFTLYVRKDDLTRHNVYFGLSADWANAYVDNATGSGVEVNPYFYASTPAMQQASLVQDRWYKVVGYVFAQGSQNVAAGSMGGVFDTTTGAKVADVQNFRWRADRPANTVHARFFDYYDQTLTGWSTSFYQPEIRELSTSPTAAIGPATATQYRYDAMGRLRTVIDPTGRQSHSLYDRVGRKVADIDGDGSLVEYRYDQADRLVSTTRYATLLTAAQINSLTDAAGNPTAVALSALRPTAATADAWTWQVHDEAGRLIRTVDATGAAIDYRYDGASRLIETRAYATLATVGAPGIFNPAAASIPPSATADRVTRQFFDADGRQVGTLDAEGFLTQIHYDRAGRVIQTSAYANLTSGGLRSTGTFEQLKTSVGTHATDIHNWSVYDGRGFLKASVNGEGEVTLYEHSSLGHVIQVVRGRKLTPPPATQPTLSQLTSAPVGSVLEVATYSRNHLGQVLTETRQLATGTETTTYTYDSLYRLTSSFTDRVAGAGPDYGTRQRYDLQGRLTGQLSGRGTAALVALGANPTTAQIDQIYQQWGTRYTYDEAGRLTSRIDPDGLNGPGNKTTYFYDADGSLAYEVNALGEVVGYAYDALNRQERTIRYADRLTAGDGLNSLQGGNIPAFASNPNWWRFPPVTASVTSILYNTDSTVRATVDELGAATAYFRDAFGQNIEQHTPTTTYGGEVTRRTYDRRGLLTSATEAVDVFNRTTALAYDAFGRTLSTIDARGGIRSSTYDRAGRAKVLTDALGYTTVYDYDARGNVTTITDRLGKSTSFSYDAFNRTQTVTTAEGLTTTTRADDRGHTLQITDGGRTKSFGYDVDGNLISVTNGLGQQSLRSFDKAGRLWETTDATGRKVHFGYDAVNRMVAEVVDPGGLNLETLYHYDAKGRRQSIRDASGVRTDYEFDLAGRVTKVIVDPNGLNLRTEFSYDRASNVTSQREGVGTAPAREILFEYDTLNRLTRQWNADPALGIETRYEYDQNDNVTRRIDRVSAGVEVATRFSYDAENRLVLTVDPTGGVVRHIYDAEGQLIQTTGFATKLTPSQMAGLSATAGFGQIYPLVAHSASDQTTKYFYDDDGRLTFIRDAVAQVTSNIYDGSNNVVRQIRYAAPYTGLPTPTEADMSAWATTASTTADRITRNVFDAAGRQTFALDALGQVTAYMYDAAGRTLSARQFLALYGPASDPTSADMTAWTATAGQAGDRTTRMVYDGAGRSTFIIDAEGYATRTEYRADGQIAAQSRYSPVLSVATGATHATMIGLLTGHDATASRTSFGYDSAGRNTSVTDAEGAITTMVLDALGRATETILATGTADQSRTTRTFDDAGRVLSETRAAGEVGVATTANWTYDGLGRVLTSVDGRSQSTQYTYDAMGRLLTKKIPLSSGQWATTTNTYDAFGNLISVTDPRQATGTFEFDRLNRQIKQTDPNGYVTLTAYGLGGAVTSVTRAGATTHFGRDKLDRLTSVTDAGGYTESYVLNAFGDRISVTNKLGGVTAYQYDRRGLMTSELLPITSIQGNGTAANVVNLFEYDARGNLTKTIEAASLGEARTTFYVYDKLDRLIQKSGDTVTVTHADFTTSTSNQLETITYDGRGNAIQTVNAAGARTLFYYDDLNRKISEVDALGTVREWTYDANSNAISARVYNQAITLPAAAGGDRPVLTGSRRETHFQYDLANRLTHTTIRDLRTGEYVGGVYQTAVVDVTTENRYDAAGNVVETLDGRGVRTLMGYDVGGRHMSTIDGEGYLTVYSRDAEGNVTQEVRYAARMTAAATPNAAVGDRITNFTYDLNGRRLTETRMGVGVYATGAPDRLTTINTQISYTYDGLGNVTRKVEANGDYADYGYDALGRQIREMGTAFVNHLGQTVRKQTDTRYNGLSQVTRLAEDAEGAFAGDQRITTLAYGAGGRLASMTDPTGFTRLFGYDAMGRVVRESYDRVQANDVAVTEGRRYGYDLLGRLTIESSASNGGTWTFGDTRSSVYNAHGEITARTLNSVVQETFDYDTAGRVWRSTAGDGVTKHLMYDRAGRTTLTVTPGGGGLPNFGNIEGVVHHLTDNGDKTIGGWAMDSATVTFSLYDGRGLLLGTREPHRELARDPVSSAVNVWADLTRSRAYNAFGEVISETDGRGFTTDFTYNTMGRLIEQRSPEVAFTNEQGVVSSARPTLQYRYDAAGRLIATRTANGYWSSRTLIAGTGHGQSEAVVASETAADSGVMTYGVDVFGDVRRITNQLGYVTQQTFDKAGRLISVQKPARAAYTYGNNTGAAIQLTDFYGYDGLGQRTKHWNSQFGSGFVERTFYDREGRVTGQTDFENRTTAYAYVWDATLTTNGLGTFGGWIKTTSHASGKTGIEREDGFGRLVGKTDLGGRVYAMGYDKAGRMVSQTSNTGQHLTWSWYNGGQLARQADLASSIRTQADYTYDATGNRIRERYVTFQGAAPAVIRQDGHATYDALGRITQFEDRSLSTTDPTRTTFTYDLNSNVRSTQTNFRHIDYGASAPSVQGSTIFNRYDAMDRMVQVEGGLSEGQIVGGRLLEYDAAGNRVRMMTSSSVQTDNQIGTGERWVPFEDPNPGGGGGPIELPPEDGGGMGGYWEYFPIYEQRQGYAVENYFYTADGYLASVGRSQDEWNTVTDTVQRSAISWISEDFRDAMGRLTYHVENTGERAGVSRTFSRTATYDRTGLVTNETTYTYLRDDIFTSTTARFNTQNISYSYTEGSVWRGVVTAVTTSGHSDAWPEGGSTTAMAGTRTSYTYNWWEDARQATIVFDSDTGSGSNPLNTSTFAYDLNGRIASVYIADARPRTVTFVTDAQGQVLSRTEQDNNPNLADPKDHYFYFNGQRIGQVTNNTEYTSTYHGEMYKRGWTGPTSPTPFRNGNYAQYGVDFDLAYEALTPNSVRSTGQSWTVRDGDTLQGIAAAVWGDAALWYLIAEHNGLTSASILTAGQTLTVPAKVGNVHNTSETFRPYDPNKAMGDLSPTQPRPPKKPGGCGVIGQVIAVAIAMVVSAYAGPVAGNLASQAFLIATGAQDDIDWKSVGITLITAGVAKGLENIPQVATAVNTISRFNPHVASAAYSATANVITQGVSVATGLQNKFSWTQVAVSAVGAFAGSVINSALPVPSLKPGTEGYKALKDWTATDHRNAFVGSMGTSFAAAGTQSLLDGTSFGDNLIATLPQVIGATIGNAIVGGMQARGMNSGKSAGKGQGGPVETLLPIPELEIQPLDIRIPSVVEASSLSLLSFDELNDAPGLIGRTNISFDPTSEELDVDFLVRSLSSQSGEARDNQLYVSGRVGRDINISGPRGTQLELFTRAIDDDIVYNLRIGDEFSPDIYSGTLEGPGFFAWPEHNVELWLEGSNVINEPSISMFYGGDTVQMLMTPGAAAALDAVGKGVTRRTGMPMVTTTAVGSETAAAGSTALPVLAAGVAIRRQMGLFEYGTQGGGLTPFLHMRYDVPGVGTPLASSPADPGLRRQFQEGYGISTQTPEEQDLASRMMLDGRNSNEINDAISELRGPSGRVSGGADAASGPFSLITYVPSSGRKFNQLTQRGWTSGSINELVNDPYATRVAVNRATGNPATSYSRRDGHYVVRDNITGSLVQMSDTRYAISATPGTGFWVPDASIRNPYIPR